MTISNWNFQFFRTTPLLMLLLTGICLRPHQNAVNYDDGINWNSKRGKCTTLSSKYTDAIQPKSMRFILIKLKCNFSLALLDLFRCRLSASIHAIASFSVFYYYLSICNFHRIELLCIVIKHFMQSVHVRRVFNANDCIWNAGDVQANEKWYALHTHNTWISLHLFIYLCRIEDLHNAIALFRHSEYKI